MKTYRALKKGAYHDEEMDSDGTWAISYGDMITLLLCFFMIFFTTDFKKQKVEKINQHLSFTLESAPVMPEKHEAKDKRMSLPDLGSADITAATVDDMVIVSFGKVSFFDSGEVMVHEKGADLLRAFAKRYLPYAGNYRLAIKGFTDKRRVLKREDLPPRKYDDNLELSALRSLAAMRILRKSGVPLDRMEIAGGGEMKAMAKILPNIEGLSVQELNALSRTIIIVVKPEQESLL